MWTAYIKSIWDSWKRIAQIGQQTVDAAMAVAASPDRIWLRPITIAAAGVIVGIHMKIKTPAASQGKFVIADNSGGAPHNVLAVTTQFSLNVSQVDITGLAVSVISGSYHLGCVSTTGGYPSLAGAYTNFLERAESFSFASPPATVPTLASNDPSECLAIWADVQYDQ